MGLMLLKMLGYVKRRLTEFLVASSRLAFRETLPCAICANIRDDNSIS